MLQIFIPANIPELNENNANKTFIHVNLVSFQTMEYFTGLFYKP